MPMTRTRMPRDRSCVRSKLGWIGLGAIGTPMALRLIEAGHDLAVWGRTPSRLAPAVKRGAIVVASAAELAARSDAVFLCVWDDASVESVVLGPRAWPKEGA